jgi:DNA-binding FrmR family transcriptional regulator
MPHSDPASDDLQGNILRRLRSAAGHLNGITGMIESSADCESILSQVLAVQAALREINRLLLRHHLDACLRPELAGVTMDRAAGERWMAEIVALYGLQQRSYARFDPFETNIHFHTTAPIQAAVRAGGDRYQAKLARILSGD